MSDRDTFEAFVSARRGALLRTAYLLTGSHHDAEDLLQTTLIKVVPKWSKIADQPEPYVRTVLSRESISRWRQRRWRELSSGTLPNPGPDPGRLESGIEGGAQREDLRVALRSLSPRQRAVVVLRYYEDLTERETAQRLGLSTGTVKSHAREALARLRDLVPTEDHATP